MIFYSITEKSTVVQCTRLRYGEFRLRKSFKQMTLLKIYNLHLLRYLGHDSATKTLRRVVFFGRLYTNLHPESEPTNRKTNEIFFFWLLNDFSYVSVHSILYWKMYKIVFRVYVFSSHEIMYLALIVFAGRYWCPDRC